MDGVHDLGGMEGYGPVVAEIGEPVFHFDWERRALGLTFTTFGLGVANGGQFRHAIERMAPEHYLTSRYYEHWLTGITTRLVESGMVTIDELEQRAGGAFPLSRPVASSGVTAPSAATTTFAVGDEVRVRAITTRGHTRCPRYVRGKHGTVVRMDDPSSVPDIEAHSADRRVEPICSVRFDALELWGAGAEPSFVHVDLWQSYLERP